jgi:hypothetical protein
MAEIDHFYRDEEKVKNTRRAQQRDALQNLQTYRYQRSATGRTLASSIQSTEDASLDGLQTPERKGGTQTLDTKHEIISAHICFNPTREALEELAREAAQVPLPVSPDCSSLESPEVKEATYPMVGDGATPQILEDCMAYKSAHNTYANFSTKGNSNHLEEQTHVRNSQSTNYGDGMDQPKSASAIFPEEKEVATLPSSQKVDGEASHSDHACESPKPHSLSSEREVESDLDAPVWGNHADTCGLLSDQDLTGSISKEQSTNGELAAFGEQQTNKEPSSASRNAVPRRPKARPSKNKEKQATGFFSLSGVFVSRQLFSR